MEEEEEGLYSTPDINAPINQLKQYFTLADGDLSHVQQKINLDFFDQYGAVINPIKLTNRIRAMQDELDCMVKDIEWIHKQKRDFVQFADVLMANRSMIQQLQRSNPTVGNSASLANNELIEDQNMLSKLNGYKTHWRSPYYPELSSMTTTTMINKNKEHQGLQSKSDCNNNNNNNPESTNEQKSTTEITQKQTGYISEKEFNSVSESIRGRCKLEDCNKIYEKLVAYYKERSHARHILTKQQMTAMGLKVVGLSGDQCLLTLRSLKLIEMSKQGVKLAKHS
ncbi:hypothetical protein SAMD00019534_014360 [Acytostelium subglobosum LB1]|uniref:hypothetical protein n=1 Tax=Acytostelium subglobosum LB1 TaxID=1410327 RepID=UPI0006449A0A|nr:hypothetical protein SAMD00019534_014360 [Acytostelium subglobosum LB1]GAM18261.1 hypothetical protein SAMD00019534_014360 [Acytostelium subglobosum LB1]|eukprot:XP_012758857.1 hypothetical protein SAMD00019534_014360 [Acytostelium subglobosum LB1]